MLMVFLLFLIIPGSCLVFNSWELNELSERWMLDVECWMLGVGC